MVSVMVLSNSHLSNGAAQAASTASCEGGKGEPQCVRRASARGVPVGCNLESRRGFLRGRFFTDSDIARPKTVPNFEFRQTPGSGKGRIQTPSDGSIVRFVARSIGLGNAAPRDLSKYE